MSEQPERDALDALRAADPVDFDRLSSASLARIRARVSEDAMTSAAPPRRWAGRTIRFGAGLAGVAALALVLVVSRPGAAPGGAPLGSPGPGSAACVEPYAGPASIAARSLAFDGTVTAISGDTVTFAVHVAYRGAPPATLTLEAPGMTGSAITSTGGPNVAVGERYLVAGDGGFAWACGYTQAYDPALASAWAAAVR
jgi:hypothetical protein